MGRHHQECGATPVKRGYPGIQQEGGMDADILQWVLSPMRYSDLSLVISEDEKPVFNDLSL